MRFSSLQRSPERRVRIPRAFHTRHLASSEFLPLLTPCSPSSLPVISDRVAPGIQPSGPCSSRRVGPRFREPSPPDVAPTR
jgi:hypothetical protein